MGKVYSKLVESFGYIAEAPADDAAELIRKQPAMSYAANHLSGNTPSGQGGQTNVPAGDPSTMKPGETRYGPGYDPNAPAPADTPTNTPVEPEKKKPTGPRKNPGTKAFQHWLNAHGAKITVDGIYGNETKTASSTYWNSIRGGNSSDPAYDAKFKEFQDMQGVGTAYNVKPSPGKAYVWLNSPLYLEAMKKYGYDPKTGDPIGGAKPAGGVPPNQGGQANKEVSTGNPALDILNKVSNPKDGMEYWANGSRYRYTNVGFDPQTGQANKANGWYKNLDPSDKLQWNANRSLSSRGYTGPDEDGAKTQFLANYKKPTATAESAELDRLKELLKF